LISSSRVSIDQPAFNRYRLKAEKLIDAKVPEQLIRVKMDAGCADASLDAHYTETGSRAFAINAASWARAIRG
jgi:hypothetical protein